MPHYCVDTSTKIVRGELNGFAHAAPHWLEIGFGNGDLMLSLATQMPAVNFIAAEVHPPGVGRLLHELEDNALHNVRVLSGDAVTYLTDCVEDGALDRILLMFPDPWHKKRHHKRRMVNAEFAELLAAKLVVGGVFHAATDWQDYAEQMLDVLDLAPALINTAGAGTYSQRPDYRIETRFERRGKSLGHGVWDLLYQRSHDLELGA